MKDKSLPWISQTPHLIWFGCSKALLQQIFFGKIPLLPILIDCFGLISHTGKAQFPHTFSYKCFRNVVAFFLKYFKVFFRPYYLTVFIKYFLNQKAVFFSAFVIPSIFLFSINYMVVE